MAVIGNLTIGFRMNSKGLKKGADESKSIINGLRKRINSVNTAIAGIGAAIGFGAIVAGLTSITKSAQGTIDATAKLADRLGTSTEALVGLQHAADLSGTSNDTLNSALEKMNVNLGKAQGGAQSARDAFESLGLNVDQLASGDPVEAVKQIADGINELPTASQKAEAAMAIFGKQGVGLLNTLAAGSDGIAAMSAEAEKLGMTYSRVDAAQVEMANDSLNRAGKIVTSLGNQLAIQLAPYIEATASRFTELATSGVSMAEVVSTSLEWIVSGLGLVADVVDVVFDAFQFFRSGVTKILAGVASGIAGLIQGIEYVANAVTGAESNFGEYAQAVADDLHNLAGEQFDDAINSFAKSPPSEGINSFFADVRQSAREAGEAIANAGNQTGGMIDDFSEAAETANDLAKSISDLETSLHDQMTTFGMSSQEAQVYRLSLAGATSEQLANVKAMSDQLKAKEKFKELQDEAKSIIEASKTPLEQYQAQIEKLNTLRDQGLLNTDQYDKAVQKAGEGLGTGIADKQPKFAALAELGSQEARDTILRTKFGGQTDQNKEDIKVAKQSLDQLKQLPALLTTIANKLTNKPEEVFSF